MLKAIGYLHSLGICRRDIKPQNVLIGPSDYTIYICDFGCAKHLVKGNLIFLIYVVDILYRLNKF